MSKTSFCYIAYASPLPTAGAVAHCLHDRDGTLPAGWQLSQGEALWLRTDRATVFFLFLPFPYPAEELTNDLAQHAAWPDWRDATKAWQSHLIVTAIGDVDEAGRRDATAALMQVAARIAARTGASAVGWSANLLFLPAHDFAGAVAAAPLPPEVLVRCRWYGQDWSRMGTRTGGLDAFDLPEIDHPPTGEDAADIALRVLNISAYLLARGLVLGDGDTIGATARGAMRVRHEREADGGLLLRLQPLAA